MTRILFALPLLLVQVLGHAQGNALLWKVSGPGIEKPSYLFGTMHLMPEAKFFITPAMQNALKECKTLVLETEADIPMAKQLELAQKMLIPEGKSVADLMPADDFARLKKVMVDTLGIKETKFTKQYGRIKPVFLSGLLLTDLLGKVKMYEQELTSMAKKAKMKVGGLETIDEQMAVIETYPLNDQVADLARSNGSMLAEFNKLVEAYAAQDLVAMKQLSDNDPAMGAIEQKFLLERNRKWIPKVAQMVKESPVFVAVGALHLVGDEGLVLALRNAGFTVDPVNIR